MDDQNTSPQNEASRSAISYLLYGDAPPPKRPRTKYCKADVTFAWLSFLLGYIMMLSWSPSQYPVGMLIFTLLCYGLTFFYIKKQNGRTDGSRLMLPISALVLSLGYLTNSNGTVLTIIALYGFFAYVLWVYTAFDGEGDRSLFDAFLLPGLGKALTVLPFGSFPAVFESASQIKSRTGKKVGKTFLWVLLGLAIAVIPTVIIFVLLSFDPRFTAIIEGLLDFDSSGISHHIGRFILGVPVSMYIFGLLYSASSGRFGRGIDREKCISASKSIRFAPTALVCAAMTPVIFLYGVFFFVQLEYFISPFTGSLPESFTYAEYAREGFFQLCTVSFFNLIMLSLSYLFCRRKNDGGAPLLLKLYCTVLSALTLVLITTALSKMIMYIGTYGLTVKRVLSSWLIILLAAIFICIVISIFLSRFNLTRALFAVFIVMLAILVFANIDGLCHRYNAERCIDGTLDITAFESPEHGARGSIDICAVPALAHIAEDASNEQKRLWAKDCLRELSDTVMQEEESIFAMNIPRIRQKLILKGYKKK